jgi:hypothetical protein
MEDINNTDSWTNFVDKLISRTKLGDLKWENYSKHTSRDNACGPVYMAEVRRERASSNTKHIGIYRSEYRYYTDEDEYEMRPDVSIEIVDNNGDRLWTLPDVRSRYELIDLVEYQVADVQSILKDFLNDDK